MYLYLPGMLTPNIYPTDEVSGYAQKVHPLIAQKISEFFSEGMTEVPEVKRALRQYVHTQFSQQYQCQPLPSDRAQQKWARCYRDDKFYAAVNTNNGVEALNKVLKYNYLPQNKNMTVSNLATLLVTAFLPESYQKYLLQNYQMSGTYRAYKDFIPSYLH